MPGQIGEGNATNQILNAEQNPLLEGELSDITVRGPKRSDTT